MHKTLTVREFERMADEYDKVKYTCKCGHRVVIPYNVDKQLCKWCHRYVFKNKQDEFRYRFEEQRRKECEYE